MAIEDTVYEGKDLETAIRSASSALGIPEGDLHYEIVEQGRRGVFGLGAKSVQIRIKPPLEAPRSTEDEDTREDVREDVREPETSDEPVASAKAGANGERRPRKRRRRKRSAGERNAAPRSSPTNPPDGESTARAPRAPIADEEISAVDGTIRRMIELMGLELTTQCVAANGGVSVELDGKDRKMLMDRNAELLTSIQFLLNRMARRAWPGVRRVQLVCEGKKSQRREDDLVELVREVAQQVSTTGRTKKLQPMNAYERRLVHITVREYPGLSSNSDGNGSMKQVRISKVKNEI